MLFVDEMCVVTDAIVIAAPAGSSLKEPGLAQSVSDVIQSFYYSTKLLLAN